MPTKESFWGEVFKVFGILLAVLAVIGLFALGGIYLTNLLGNWALIPLILVLCFFGSILAAWIGR